MARTKAKSLTKKKNKKSTSSHKDQPNVHSSITNENSPNQQSTVYDEATKKKNSRFTPKQKNQDLSQYLVTTENKLFNASTNKDESFIVSDFTLKDNTLVDLSEQCVIDTIDNTATTNSEKISSHELPEVPERKTPLFIIDTSSPKNIYNDYMQLDMSLADFISQLPTLHQKQIKKLCLITMNRNISINEIEALTTSKERNTRYLATHCILHKIRSSYSVKNKTDYSDILYEVIESRTRDVDHNIRAICYEYLFEIYKYIDVKVRYVNSGLEDKNDTVRKKTIKGLQQIIMKQSIPSIKTKIINLCQYEKNDTNKKEACKLLLMMYSNNMVNSDEIFAILDNFNEREIQDLYVHLRNESSTVDVLRKFNSNAIKKITLNDNDMKDLIDEVQQDTELLRTLSIITKPKNNIIKELCAFLHTYKENTNNIKNIINALYLIDNTHFTAEHEQLSDILFSILKSYNDTELYEYIFKLFYKLENIYSNVRVILEKIKYIDNDAYILYILKYFDFSDFVNDKCCLETKLLACFWMVKNENYTALKTLNMEINDCTDFNTAANYIQHLNIIAKGGFDILSADFDRENFVVYDNTTAINYIYYSLCFIAILYLDKNDPLISDTYTKISHLLPVHKYLFACKRQQIMTYLKNTKIIDDLFVDLFFRQLADITTLSLCDIKVISTHVTKKVKKCNVYDWMLRLQSCEKFYDNCFIFFVKFLNDNECTKLIKTVKINCKYKNMLAAKCKKTSRVDIVKDEKESSTSKVESKSDEVIAEESDKEVVHL